MLKMKAELCVESKVTSGRANVNELVTAAVRGHWTAELLAGLLNKYQQQMLDEYLGVRWQVKEQIEFGCMYCCSTLLVRRGFRPRQIRTSVGTINFKLYQLSCRFCKSTFSPFI